MQSKSNNKEIKGYKILGKVAKGGMGELYKGIHPGLNKEIILKKLMSRATTSFSDRFKREAALMMEVSHPNVVRLFDYFKDGNSSYIVMEYIPGYNLSEFIGKFGKLPVYLASYIAIEVAKGLEYAHSKGIIHRDIKPGNVLISMSGEIKLTDFGIAFKSSREDDITKTGTLLGTPSYMSPEQIYSSKDVDARTDIYSLGVIFYEMITGIKPFSNQFSIENVLKIKKGKCQSIRTVNKNVPPKLVKIIKKMMNPKKAYRYKTITEFINKIQPFIMKKFKDPVFLKDSFNKLIVKQNPLHELNYFKYPGYFIVFSRIFNFSIIFLIILLILFFIRNFYPGILVYLTYPEKFGIVNIKITDEELIQYGSLEFVSQNDQFQKKIYLNSSSKSMELKNLLMPSSKYSVYLNIHDNLYVKEYVINPYNISKINNLNFAIQEPVTKKLNLNIKVYDTTMTYEINDYKLYYKKTNENNWTEFKPEIDFYNGMSYDFSIYSEKYNVSIIKNVMIGKRQTDLNLIFVLTIKRISVKFKAPKVPLILKIDNHDFGFIDIDGVVQEKYILTTDKEIFLIPGIHTLNLYNKERSINSNFELNMTKIKNYIININYNENTKKITAKME